MIKDRRRRLGITQTQLAKSVGLSQSYISSIEARKGCFSPTLRQVKKISRALNFNLIELTIWLFEQDEHEN